MSTVNPPAGYYADPSVPGYIRYWDGSEWVAGSSRPAPEEPAARPQGSVQGGSGGGAVAGAGARRYGHVPQQFTPSPTQAPSPTPMPFAQRSSAPVSARSGNSYVFPGQGGNPFTGLPGQEFSAPRTTVVELANPGPRILARIIDLGVAAILSAPITVTLLLIAHQHDHQYVLRLDAEATSSYTTLGMDGVGIALWVGALLALLIASVGYEGYRLGRSGQTAGKRLAGVRVVRIPEGTPLGRGGVGTRRALLFWVLAIIPVVDVAALGGVLWGRPYRQGAHEKATSTVTVKA